MESPEKTGYCLLELLRIVTPLSGKNDTLGKSLITWGSHDAVCIPDKYYFPDIDGATTKYFDCHATAYEGIEHQPLYLCRQSGTQPDLIQELAKLTSIDMNKRQWLYSLTFFQIDFSSDSPVVKSLTELIGAFDGNCRLPHQTFLNLGESDIAVLMKTDRLTEVQKCLKEIHTAVPIVRHRTMIIFPYRYGETTTAELYRMDIMGKWFDGCKFVEEFVVDHHFHEIFSLPFGSLPSDLKFIFGNYDVYHTVDTSAELLDCRLKGRNDYYRCSKTSPLLPLEMIEFQDTKSFEKCTEEYRKDILYLNQAFDEWIAYAIQAGHADYIPSDFDRTKKTLINLYNYFIRLDETGFAPDVYCHIHPFFTELTELIVSLKRYCEADNPSEDKDFAIRQVSDQLKLLLDELQQFLGIVSLSAGTFSESHGSYMRSVNGALKLLCAYHTVAYLIHKETKCSVYQNPTEEQKQVYEHSHCALLIQPTRCAKTSAYNYFEQLSPEHHITVVKANFGDLFHTKVMLFNIAHEVGHFSGNRLRDERNPLFLSAALRYMLLENAFETKLIYPIQDIIKKIPSVQEELEQYKELNDKQIWNVQLETVWAEALIKQICAIADNFTVELAPKVKAGVSKDDSRFAFVNGYLADYIDYAAEYYDKWRHNPNLPEALWTSLAKALTDCYRSAVSVLKQDDTIFIPDVPKNKIYAFAMYLFNNRDTIKRECIDDVLQISEDDFYNYCKEVEIAFEDVYSDLFAVHVLDLSQEEYIDYFSIIDELHGTKEDYTALTFMMRLYAVLAAHYRVTDKEYTAIIMKLTGRNDDNMEETLRRFLLLKEFYLTDILKYATKLSDGAFKDYGTKNFSDVRNFYRNETPEALYSLWIRGMERGYSGDKDVFRELTGATV